MRYDSNGNIGCHHNKNTCHRRDAGNRADATTMRQKKKRIRKTLAISAFHSNHAMGSTCLLSIKEREKECILPSLRLPSHPKSGIIIWHEAAIWCWCSFAPHLQYTPQHNSKANRNCHIRESKRDTWSALLWALYFAFQQFDWKPPVFAAMHALCVNTKYVHIFGGAQCSFTISPSSVTSSSTSASYSSSSTIVRKKKKHRKSKMPSINWRIRCDAENSQSKFHR